MKSPAYSNVRDFRSSQAAYTSYGTTNDRYDYQSGYRSPRYPQPSQPIKQLYRSLISDEPSGKQRSYLDGPSDTRYQRKAISQTFLESDDKKQKASYGRGNYPEDDKYEVQSYINHKHKESQSTFPSYGTSAKNTSSSYMRQNQQIIRSKSPQTRQKLNVTELSSPKKYTNSREQDHKTADFKDKMFKKKDAISTSPKQLYDKIQQAGHKKVVSPKEKGSIYSQSMGQDQLTIQRVRDYLRFKLMSPTSSSGIYDPESFRSSLNQNTKSLYLSDFIVGKEKGDGKFGKVYTCLHKKTGTFYALKKVLKETIRKSMMENQFVWEIKLQSFFNHSNIVKLYGIFSDHKHIYLLLEYMEQGSLYEYMKKFKNGLPQQIVSRRMREVCSAVAYLHDLEVAHRDIKPENIVLSNGVSKLCDFGWSTLTKDRRNTYCGTFDYAPPQILLGKDYDGRVDLWSMGVLTYELLTGKLPFYSISRQQTIKNITGVDTKQLHFPNNISSDAKNFIRCLLNKQPELRKGASELLSHPFLKKYQDVLF